MSKEKDDLNDKRRLYFILLYPETSEYDFNSALRVLKSYKYYAFNKHLPDVDDKKEHIHFYLRLDNACTPSALSKKTGIPVRWLGKKVKSERSCIRYLIHKDDEDKIQYKKSDCNVSNCFERQFNKCFDDLKTNEEIIKDIYNKIDYFVDLGYASTQVVKELLLFINEECYDDIYKRYRFEFTSYINICCEKSKYGLKLS